MSNSPTDPITVVLAQCTGSKREGEWPARTLYDKSDYFQKQKAYARTVGDRWYIQSAKYGLVHPDGRVESYDKRARNLDDAEAWAKDIADELRVRVAESAVVHVLGGKRYADPLTPHLEAWGFDVVEPLRGQGIGVRMQTLDRLVSETLEGYA